MGAELDLDAILATARAAKAEVGSGWWTHRDALRKLTRPDTIIALVERLQQLDAENNELQRQRYEAQARIQRMERGNTGSAEPNGE